MAINQFTNISYITNTEVMDVWVMKTLSNFFHPPHFYSTHIGHS